MLTRDEFIAKIKKLRKPIPGKTGTATYNFFQFDGKMLHFRRVEKQTHWKLDIDVLFNIYRANKFINTSVVKKTKNRKVNSPSVAVLMALGCIDAEGNRK